MGTRQMVRCCLARLGQRRRKHDHHARTPTASHTCTHNRHSLSVHIHIGDANRNLSRRYVLWTGKFSYKHTFSLQGVSAYRSPLGTPGDGGTPGNATPAREAKTPRNLQCTLGQAGTIVGREQVSARDQETARYQCYAGGLRESAGGHGAVAERAIARVLGSLVSASCLVGAAGDQRALRSPRDRVHFRGEEILRDD